VETRFAFEEVSKVYNKKVPGNKGSLLPALKNVNLKIYENKINALVGKSGCGKSTTARLLMRLENYDTGEILYKGKNLEAMPKKEFRKKNQMMFQNPLLSVNPCFKVYKILSEPLIVYKKNKKEIKERIAHLLEIFELPSAYLEKYPSELSGGELQRIVLARALALEPEFVILDEPFSSLDEIMAARLIRYFKKIFKQLDIGVLYISHHLERVKFLADYVAVMEKGRIIYHDTTTNWQAVNSG
jgi:ABC-type glutathione transport system ATPase component